ncbi:MAG TPA: DUF362 domain-containing protein [Bryobacteraceae bacterium]|nr:DUF362 domain-containing protein [Bryobacteraceae bacterium]
MTRRELLALAASAVALRADTAPAAPVSIARCPSYDEDLTAVIGKMFDQLGGLERIVRNKTITVKLNLTGSPALRFQGKPLGSTHYSNPKTIMAMVHLLDRAGATRIRLVESAWATSGPLEEYMLDSGWNVRALKGVSSKLEFENTNALGTGKRYVDLKPVNGGYMYPAYVLNSAYRDTDVFMSMAKLKNHETCGVTLSMKNCFGITPASIYGDDAGIDEPNENPTKGRGSVCHFGKRQPAKIAPPEHDPSSSRDSGHRMPRIVADIASARPIDIAFIDGIETMSGGEGPWIRSRPLKWVRPGVLILGTNPVNTDAVATAVMGYNPQADRGTAPFQTCDSTLKLAEALGLGTTDLKRIDVRGAAIKDVVFPFSA